LKNTGCLPLGISGRKRPDVLGGKT
jgi:hypothetical protein